MKIDVVRLQGKELSVKGEKQLLAKHFESIVASESMRKDLEKERQDLVDANLELAADMKLRKDEITTSSY